MFKYLLHTTSSRIVYTVCDDSGHILLPQVYWPSCAYVTVMNYFLSTILPSRAIVVSRERREWMVHQGVQVSMDQVDLMAQLGHKEIK